MKFPSSNLPPQPHLALSAWLALVLAATAGTVPCGNPEPTEPEPCGGGCEEGSEQCPDEGSGNDSRTEYGPIMKIPTGASGMPADTKQRFFQPYGSNGISRARDLEVQSTTSLLPLRFDRMYQSRYREGTVDAMGHGSTWTHSYSHRLWVSSTNKRSIFLPDGTITEFTAGGTVTFEGTTQTEHLPTAGKGVRLYQGGAGGNWFTMLFANGKRHVFERVTAGGTSLYHPRWSADAEGRRQTYTTDAKARIIKAEDAGANSISLTYSAIQIDRKSNINLTTLFGNPTAGWNEIVRPTTSAYRWYQISSSEQDFCNFAEIEFWGKDSGGVEYKLGGTPYGTGPEHPDVPGSTYDKAFDGDTATAYKFSRRLYGIAGIDLGAGNAKKLQKIRFYPNAGTGAVPLASFKNATIEARTEQPQFIEVLQKVEASDGRAVNYVYDTITDTSIDQKHLVLVGVDYDGDLAATAATDAKFTYTFSTEGVGPTIEKIYEPRTLGQVPHLKFEYLGTNVDPRGMISKVRNADNNEIIVENIPEAGKRKIVFPGGREMEVAYPGDSPRFDKIKDASGQETQYTWNGSSRFLQSSSDQAGRTTTYQFNTRGQRTSLGREDGYNELTSYDASGRLLTVTQGAAGHPSRTTTWTRDTEGKATRKDYPDSSYETYTYNALGLVTEKRERNGSITRWTYDPTGLLLSLTRASGAPEEETVSYTYYGLGDPSGSPARFLKTSTDQRGRTTTHQYSGRGQVTKTTYPDGSFREKTYDASGNLLSESDGTDTRTWAYNGYKQLTAITDALGHITQYYYGDGGIACGCYNNGGPTLVISPEGRQTFREYDEQWRISRETAGYSTPEAATTEWYYDLVGNVSLKVLPGGVNHVYTYDSRNRQISESVQGGGLNLTSTWAFDPFGNLLTETKPGARTTSWTYNVMDKVSSVTDALGMVTQHGYDAADNLISETRGYSGPLAKTTANGYDLLNRRVLVTHPDSTTQAMTYHPGGAVHTKTDELGRTVTMDDSLVSWNDSKGGAWTSFVATMTDAAGNVWRRHDSPKGRFAGVTMSVSPLGRADELHATADGTTAESRTGLAIAGSGLTADVAVTTFTYDKDHLPLSQTVDPGGLNEQTSYTYDARGNRLTMTDPLNRTTSTSYDPRGNPTKHTLVDGRETLSTYDAMNRRVSETDAENRVTTWSYFRETSVIATLRDGRSQLTTWTLNLLGQVQAKASANGDTDLYTYDSLHRLATHRTPKNETCTFFYDLRDRLTLSDWNTSTPDTARDYHANGLLKTMDNGVARSEYSYSVRNELLAEVTTGVAQVSYSYDNDGLRAGMSSSLGSAAGPAVGYSWTARRQLGEVLSDGPPPLATYTHDKAGRVTSVAHENGVSEVKSYNHAGELLANTHYLGGAVIDGHSYSLDATGRRTAETFQDGVTASRIYAYDDADQVTGASYGGGASDSYAYDQAGNRTTATVAGLGGVFTTYTANNANQYTSVTGQPAPVHDANGNLTSTRGAALVWDSENRLLSASDGVKKVEYTYDGRHRRMTRKVTSLSTSAVTEHTRFLHDGWNVIGEADLTAPTVTFARIYTWGEDLSGTLQGAGGVGGLLMVEETGPTTVAYHYHYDGNGNVTRISNSSGAAAASYRYDAFGNTLAAAGSYAAQNRYRFSTKPLDGDLAALPLYYYGFRYYDPTSGRWASKDPIEELGGGNLYAFNFNQPISLIDVLGRQPKGPAYPGGGTMRPDKPKSNCLGHACRTGKNEKGMPDVDWDPSPDQSCTKPCKAPYTRVILYYPQDGGKNQDPETQPPFHAVGEDTGNTWTSQMGEGGSVIDGITDPDTHTGWYYCQVFPDKCKNGDGPKPPPPMKKVCICVCPKGQGGKTD